MSLLYAARDAGLGGDDGFGWHRIFIWQWLRGTARKEFVTGYPLLSEEGSLRDHREVSHMGGAAPTGETFLLASSRSSWLLAWWRGFEDILWSVYNSWARLVLSWGLKGNIAVLCKVQQGLWYKVIFYLCGFGESPFLI